MRNWLKMTSLALVCVLLAASPVFAKGDTLTVAITQVPKTLDPQATPDAQAHNAIYQINETLVTLDKESNLAPLLAERWEILPDNVSYKLYLKKGVKFHNGETMTADDVIYTFKRAMSPVGAAVKTYSNTLADVQKVDDHTVILKADKPMGDTFLVGLCHPWASILNQKAVEAAGKDYGQKPVGTGKFQFKFWAIGDRLELERFDGYHGEKAKLKNVILRTIVEASSRTIELESGAVDLIMDPAPVDISRIRANPKLEVVEIPSCRLFHMGIDVTKAPFDNPKVRQAVSHAINRPALCKLVFRGFAQPARGPMTSAIKYNKFDATPPIKEDAQLAKKLLAEGGYPNGFKMKLLISDRTDYTNMAQIIQANLKEIGVDMEIEVAEWGTWLDLVRQPGHNPYLNNWWGGAPALDPLFLLSPFHSSGIPTINRMFYNNPEIDKLLDEGRALRDGPERAAVYGKVWDILNADLPWIPLLESMNMYGQVKGLKGLDHSPSIVNYYGNIYFE